MRFLFYITAILLKTYFKNMAQTAGVHPFPIAGRVASARERTLGMTSIERAWRKQWLQDQILDPNEPCDNPEYWKERTNPIRRIYKAVTF